MNRRHVFTPPFFSIAALLPISVLTPLSAVAQENITLSEVVVSAAGYEQSVADAPASISVITRESLEQRAYRDITDALRDVPGVVVTGGGDGQDISLRGMPVQYTLWLVDGRRQSTRETQPNGGGGFQKDWLPPLSAIERIEVIRGPMSTLYGSEALGGVINIITRRVSDEWSGNLRLETTYQEDRASGDEHQQQLYLSGPLIKDTLGLRLQGQFQKREEDRIVRGYAGREFSNLSARFSWTPHQDHDIDIEAGRQAQDRTFRPGFSLAGSSASSTENEREYISASHQGRWSHFTSDSYLQQETGYNRGRDIEINNTVFDSRVVVPLGAHFVTAGVNYEHEQLNDTTSNANASLTEITQSQWAIFVEDEWMLADTVSVTGGLRLDDNESFGNHLSPRLYGVWHFQPEWTLKGGVSTGYRAPNLRDLTPGWVQASRGGDIYGNPDLQPETSVNHEVGLLYQGDGGLSANVTAFYNEFNDKISRAACPSAICLGSPNSAGADPTYNINIDKAVTQGVEAGVAHSLTPSLNLQASYTYTDSEQRSGENAGQPLTQLPTHLLNAGIDWQASADLGIWARYSFRGKESQPTTPDTRRAVRAPSYATWDAGARWSFAPNMHVMVGVYNLFDKDIGQDSFGYVEDGRRYWAGLNIDF